MEALPAICESQVTCASRLLMNLEDDGASLLQRRSLEPLAVRGRPVTISASCPAVLWATLAFMALALIFAMWNLRRRASEGMLNDKAAMGPRVGTQLLYLMLLIVKNADMTLLLPVALDLAAALQCGAFASGLLISSNMAFAAFGVAFGGWLSRGWRYNRIRLAIFMLALGIAVFAFILMLVLCTELVQRQPRAVLGLLVAGRAMTGMAASAGGVLTNLVAIRAILPQHMASLCVAKFVCINAGIGLGPVLSSIQLRNSGDTGVEGAVFTRTILALCPVAIAWASIAALSSFVLNDDIQPCTEQAEELRSRSTASKTDTIAESMSVDERKELVHHALLYGFERAFTVCALEAGLAMHLEVGFGWPIASVGYGLGGVCLATMVLGILVMAIRQCSSLTDSQYIRILAPAGAAASFCLFGSKQRSPLCLLLAAGTSYACAYVANGIVDANALQVTISNTMYSSDMFVFAAEWVTSFGRTLAAPTVRHILEASGWNYFAALQIGICCCGCISALQVSSQLRAVTLQQK
eukprot:TRINITY_DN9576_c0_g1_i1.p1 TRINITY_DN9576_c0_g1~~TRINITY_DN9576_c0_g1_i1.p1  ORF type:complete len:525 (+),score=72.09 TRINITY_DN9576_c0_g1_i1:54-1628(+)